MRVQEVTHNKNSDGTTSQERVVLSAVTGNSDENKQWAKYTPVAQFTIQIDNPDAMNKLSRGHEFYVDFTPAVVAESKQ